MRGKFREGSRLGWWRDQIRGGLGNPQDHGGAVGDKDIAHAVRARTSREQDKTATEERMAGVGDLDFCQVVDRWVVDRGIKMFGRSTRSTMTGCSACCKNASKMERSCGSSRSGSRRECWTPTAPCYIPRAVRPKGVSLHFLQSC